ncbi:DUF2062 domain-containing protein [Kiritimatiellaeota bacterium B1221]|nr:DUF2062 domain-containing protein [Kiritimatiellaeota bacterium B1221]
MKSFFRKIKNTVVGALKQGWSASAVCWSSAWGLTIGLFPIYGVTTATLGLIGLVWKLNHAIMQAFNYLISPLKFILIIPYIRLGEWVFQTDKPFRLSLPEFTRQFKASPLETLSEFAMTFVHAICGWALSAPVWMLVTYFTMMILLKTGSATRKQLQGAQS